MPGDRPSRWWRWSVAAGVGLVVLLAVVGPMLAPHPVERAVGMPFAPPSGEALLGTDRLGRDVLSHLLTGGTHLLVVSAVIAVAVTVLSAVLGTVAAVRPRAGAVIELAGDLVILLPAVLGILLVLTAWPQGGEAALITVALVFGVPYCARLFAAAAASIASTGYIEAAIASGESLPHLVFREVLPNLRAVFATQLGLRFVVAVYLVSTVAFLGLPGIGPDNWAIMVRDNAPGLLLNPWSVLAPSAAIAIVAVGVNLVVTGGTTNRRRVTSKKNAPTSAADPGSGATTSVRTSTGGYETSAVDGSTAGVDHADAMAGDAADVVVVDGLRVVAENGAVLLAPLSFRLVAGTVTALTGASGAGKSTAMRALLGHLPVGARHEGAVWVGGQDVFILDAVALRSFRRERIAYVGQDPGSELNPLMRVRSLLAEAAPTSTADDHRAVLERVGLDSTFLRRRCGRLSGGQQRRIALARAVLRRPTVLLLDEPLAGLHGALRTEIARLITDLATSESTAILLSGHDTATVHAIADEVVEVVPLHVLPIADDSGAGGRAAAEACSRSRPVAEPLGTVGGAGAGAKSTEVGGRNGLVAERDGAARPTGSKPARDLGGPAGVVEPIDEPGRAASTFETGENGPTSGAGAGSAADAPTAGVVFRASGIGAWAEGHELLADVELSVRSGEALAVVGPSGAGKTTLARVIAGLHTSATGTVELRGVRTVVGRRRRIKSEVNGIQLVTQNPLAALNPRRTVEQTLARPLRRIARVPRHEVRAHVATLLADVELPTDLSTRHPHELSGGQRQRVALARALAAKPAVLICDEITTALDTATAAAIMTLLDHLRAEHGTAVLLISHDMALVTKHCTELRTLDHGRVVESGAPATVLAGPAHQATADLIG
ncbi:ATP-binding cassette domain-containing protein [Nocardia sp. NPDC058176]|uniref:ABC transporter ATP-binding protein/permease n=1 Tax=Nocardia sp. NPDC058176 TaxID=3346368 RepID=UPI0036D89CEA